jgi:hypothetical protein
MLVDNVAENTDILLADPTIYNEGSKQEMHLGARFSKSLRSLVTSLVPKDARDITLPDENLDASASAGLTNDSYLAVPDKLNIYRGITPVDGDEMQPIIRRTMPYIKQHDETGVRQYTENHDLIKNHRSQLAPSVMKTEVQATFKSTKKWEGMIVDIMDDSFSARLVGDDTSQDDEYTTFTFEEIDPADHELIVPGAIFYWNIGYTINSVGTKTRDSIIIFRRSPRWSPSDRREIVEDSKKILRCFDDSSRA